MWVGRGLWEALSKPLTLWVFSSSSFSSDPGHVALAGGPGGRRPQPCSTAREGPHPGPATATATATALQRGSPGSRVPGRPRPGCLLRPAPGERGPLFRGPRACQGRSAPSFVPTPQNAVVWARPRLESSVWNPTTHARNTHFTDQGGKCGWGAWAAQAGRRGPGQGQVTVALRAGHPVEGKPPKALLRCSVGPGSRKDKPGGGGAVLLHREVPAGVPVRLVQNPCCMPSCGPHSADGHRRPWLRDTRLTRLQSTSPEQTHPGTG